MTEPLLHIEAIETFYGPIQAIRVRVTGSRTWADRDRSWCQWRG